MKSQYILKHLLVIIIILFFLLNVHPIAVGLNVVASFLLGFALEDGQLWRDILDHHLATEVSVAQNWSRAPDPHERRDGDETGNDAAHRDIPASGGRWWFAEVANPYLVIALDLFLW